ncbi:MAG: hypothetical protein AAF125_03090 [Chloroflexota bacterium]
MEPEIHSILADAFGLPDLLCIQRERVEHRGQIVMRPQLIWVASTRHYSGVPLPFPSEKEAPRNLYNGKLHLAFVHTNLWTKAAIYFDDIGRFNESYPYAVDVDPSRDRLRESLACFDFTFGDGPITLSGDRLPSLDVSLFISTSQWKRQAISIHLDEKPFHQGMNGLWNNLMETIQNVAAAYDNPDLTQFTRPRYWFNLDEIE